jgi:hypothetical protein
MTLSCSRFFPELQKLTVHPALSMTPWKSPAPIPIQAFCINTKAGLYCWLLPVVPFIAGIVSEGIFPTPIIYLADNTGEKVWTTLLTIPASVK